MTVRRFIQIRLQHETVLVYFVWVVRNEPDSRRECVLSHNIPLDIQRLAIIRGQVIDRRLLVCLLRRDLLPSARLLLLLWYVGLCSHSIVIVIILFVFVHLSMVLLPRMVGDGRHFDRLPLFWLVLYRRNTYVRRHGIRWVGQGPVARGWLALAPVREDRLLVAH